MSKDCTTCKYYSTDSPDFAGQIPTCARFGTPLGLTAGDSTGTRAELARSAAASCAGYLSVTSADVPVAITKRLSHEVGTSTNMGKAMKYRSGEGASDAKANSCSKCRWYLPPKLALSELGVGFGVCTAFGEMVGPRELGPKAVACEVGVAGANATDASGVFLDPKFEVGLAASVSNAISSFGRYDPTWHTKTDPREYVSDRPVSLDDQACGIRAWRKVNDPTGTVAPAWMPIFDWKAVGCTRDPRESYGDHKPQLYVDHAALLHLFAFLYMGAITADEASGAQTALTETLALVGGSGTGKTEFFVWVAYLMDLPVTRISLSPSTDPHEFFGVPTLEENEHGVQVTGFKRGRFSAAYEKSGVIILDEANSAKDAIWYTLRPALDSAGQFAIEAEAEVIVKDPYCFIGMAYNTVDSAYRGTRELSAADADRIVRFELGLPDLDTERTIVKRHCESIGYKISDALLDVLMNVTVQLRQMNEDRTLLTPWTIRSNVRVAKLTLGLPIEMAYRLAVTEGLPTAQKELIISTVRNLL